MSGWSDCEAGHQVSYKDSEWDECPVCLRDRAEAEIAKALGLEASAPAVEILNQITYLVRVREKAKEVGPDMAYTGRYGVPVTHEQWCLVGELLQRGLHGSSLDEVLAGLLGAALRQAVFDGWCGRTEIREVGGG